MIFGKISKKFVTELQVLSIYYKPDRNQSKIRVWTGESMKNYVQYIQKN